jgi:acyl-coenzyme A thioesterase PaaI-like protein
MPPACTASADLRQQHHPNCVVCSPANAFGLKLEFALDDQGIATAKFDCPPHLVGYEGLLHGGIVSSLLDGAMTNCLFLHSHVAVTAELIVRFRHPVRLGRPAVVRAWLVHDEPPVFRLKAELMQDEVSKATAQGAFMLPKPVASQTRGARPPHQVS